MYGSVAGGSGGMAGGMIAGSSTGGRNMVSPNKIMS